MTGRVPVRGGGGWLARAELPLANYLEGGGGRGKERAVGFSIFNFNLIKVRTGRYQCTGTVGRYRYLPTGSWWGGGGGGWAHAELPLVN